MLFHLIPFGCIWFIFVAYFVFSSQKNASRNVYGDDKTKPCSNDDHAVVFAPNARPCADTSVAGMAAMLGTDGIAAANPPAVRLLMHIVRQ